MFLSVSTGNKKKSKPKNEKENNLKASFKMIKARRGWNVIPNFAFCTETFAKGVSLSRALEKKTSYMANTMFSFNIVRKRLIFLILRVYIYTYMYT